jgi:hypothetical protein
VVLEYLHQVPASFIFAGKLAFEAFGGDRCPFCYQLAMGFVNFLQEAIQVPVQGIGGLFGAGNPPGDGKAQVNWHRAGLVVLGLFQVKKQAEIDFHNSDFYKLDKFSKAATVNQDFQRINKLHVSNLQQIW